MKPHVTLLVLACVLLGASPATAEIEAVAVKVEGKVGWRAGNNGDWKRLEEKQKLRTDSQIKTAEGAQAVIDIAGKGVITVHELSYVSLGTLAGGERDARIGIGVFFGRLWGRFKRDGDEDRSAMRIDTPAAVASVRGTEFYVESERESRNARVGVWDGVVAVVSRVDADKVVEVQSGWEVLVLYRQPLSTPQEMEKERIERQQRFNEQLEQLGAAGLLAPVRGMAEMNEMQVNEAEDAINSANLIQKGDAQAREDMAKLKIALARLHADTGHVPGRGANAVSARKHLRCLVENADGRGREIDGWDGPYIDSDLKDPFGGSYGVYMKMNRFLVLNSLGLDRASGGNDDVEVLYSLKALAEDAEEQRANK